MKNNVNPNNILGVDKGYTALFPTNSGRFYGEKLNQFLTKEVGISLEFGLKIGVPK